MIIKKIWDLFIQPFQGNTVPDDKSDDNLSLYELTMKHNLGPAQIEVMGHIMRDDRQQRYHAAYAELITPEEELEAEMFIMCKDGMTPEERKRGHAAVLKVFAAKNEALKAMVRR